MRKLIVAITAIAFVSALSAPVVAQDKAGGSTAPAAQSGDTMSKGEGMKMSKKTSKKSKKSAKKSGDDTTKQ